jgi:hypothetical protein
VTAGTGNADVYYLAAQVAAALGGGARPHRAEDGAVITAGAARLTLEVVWGDPGRLEVTGIYPPTRLERLHRARITVRIDRGPAVIAREITLRLLPGYLAELGRVGDHTARETRDSGLREALGAEVTALFGGDSFTREAGWQGHGTETVFNAAGGADGTVRMSGDAARVALDLRGIPAGTALRMLAVLAADGAPAN